MMRAMKVSKKMISGVLAAALVVGAGAMGAAAWEHPANAAYVELSSSSFSTTSETRADPFMYVEGRNTSAKQRVCFEMQYSNGSGWTKDVQYLVSPGTNLLKQETNHRDSATLWRLLLDPYGIVNGATAYGWIW